MTRFKSYLVKLTLGCTLTLSANAQALELQAISDFINLDSGEVPYYIETAGNRNALAINAANPTYREKFARAEHGFTGADGLYDITINALGEIDGDGAYRLLVNGVVQGELINEPVSTDYTIIEHVFLGIALNYSDVIGVESNAVSNDTIPEGDGFAFARGRWQSMVLTEHAPEEIVADTTVDLGISISTIESLAYEGGQAPVIVSVINNSQTNTATAPIIEIALPEEMSLSSSAECTATSTGAVCPLPNLAPGEISTVSFTGDINAAGWISLNAWVSTDQVDSDRANNTTTLTFASEASPVIGATTQITDANSDEDEFEESIDMATSDEDELEESIDMATSNEDGLEETIVMATNTEAMTDSDSGATGLQGLLTLILFCAYRINRKQLFANA